MGNAQSSSPDKTSPKRTLTQIIDYVATNYILTSNFQDMAKLSDIKYCNDLVILTSKIIANNLNDMEVEYLAQRIKDGVEVNEMKNDNIIFFDKNKLNKLNVKSTIKKKRLCIGIAKFYVKIAHIFSAIVTTVNPTYQYKDSTGTMQEVGLMNKSLIPKTEVTTRIKNSLCSKRIQTLKNKNDYDVDNNEEVTVNPSFCRMNYDKRTGETKMLTSEPGIPELQKLYNDKYNYENGTFDSMTPETKKKYENDVKTFYKVFSGQPKVPSSVKKFSEIPLKDFQKSEGCLYNYKGKPEGLYTKKYKGTLKEKLFSDYANHIKKMMQTTTTNQNKLLKIIDKLFVFNINPKTNRKEIEIGPKLTEEKLQEIVIETRGIITNLYLTCENEFIKGIEIFEAIVEKQIMDTTIDQIKSLEEEVEELNIIPPEPKQENVSLEEKLVPEIKKEPPAPAQAQGSQDAIP